MERKSGQDRIKVIARIRPLNAKERSRNDSKGLVSSGQSIQLEQIGGNFSKKFLLDAVLDEDSSQEQVFENIIPLLESYIDGYNCTVFTYGQTGTGKTFTMLGYDIWEMAHNSANNPEKSLTDIARDEAYMGIVPRAMKWILKQLSDSHLSYTISVSYVELYNDIKIIDLLDMSPDSVKPSLDIRENKKGEIIIPGLTRIEVQTIDQILKVLWDGAKCRSVAATDMNDHSSRSHTVFLVYLQTQHLNEIKTSKLCLVDLAGSEKWKSHQMATFSESRIKELTSINRSLSALGNCISALLKAGRGHIPYRDSKLTRLLQDSLGGNTRTSFIVTISPSLISLEETTSTLQFADRAMKVQVMATSNTSIMTQASMPSSSVQYYEEEMKKYQQEINRLKSLLQVIVQKSSSEQNQSANITQLAHEIELLNSDTSSGDFNKGTLDLESCLSQELMELKEENLRLTQELYASQEEIQSLQEEKRLILSAVYEGEEFSLEREYEGEDTQDETEGMKLKLVYHPTNQDNLMGEAESNQGMVKQKASSRLQLRVLSVQQEELERRKEELEEADAVQEDRWKWLQQYHNWLQTQTNPLNQFPKRSSSNTPETLDEEVYHRVCLMEASILLQADELQRTKKLFLQTNGRLQQELKEATTELDEIYAERAANAERIQFLEEEIHKLLNETENLQDRTSNWSSPGGKDRTSRPSYIPVRVKSRPKSQAQAILRYAQGSKPPEPSGLPPRKPPEPSIPPPPGVFQALMKVENQISPKNPEIDVFSDDFSPQKFLDSLKIAHLRDEFDVSATSDHTHLPPPTTSSKIKTYLGQKLSAESPHSSPSYSPDLNNEGWQMAENQRIETRRKIVSPSSAFLPVIDPSEYKPPDNPQKMKAKSSEKKENILKVNPKKIDFSESKVSPKAPPKASSNGKIGSDIANPPLSTSEFLYVGQIDVNAALAKANNIMKKHSLPEVSAVSQQVSSPSEAPTEKPPKRSLKPREKTWKMIQDQHSGRYYYYNVHTQESTWDRPNDKDIEPIMESSQTSDYYQQSQQSDPVPEISAADHQSSEENFAPMTHDESLISSPKTRTEIEVNEPMVTLQTEPEPDTTKKKSTFASAALKHIRRASIIKDMDQQLSSVAESEEENTLDISSGYIDASSALALADSILEKRNIHLETSRDDGSSTQNTNEEKIESSKGKNSKKSKEKQKKLWRAIEDPNSQRTYYHNRATGETTWNRPTDEELEMLYGG